MLSTDSRSSSDPIAAEPRQPDPMRSDPTRHEPTPSRPIAWASESGQATAEYALVLLGAAAVALMLAAWAAKSGAISDLFDAIVGQLLDKAR